MFTVDTTRGNSVTQNCSYIQNPGFPATSNAVTALSYTVNKCDPGTIADIVAMICSAQPFHVSNLYRYTKRTIA